MFDLAAELDGVGFYATARDWQSGRVDYDEVIERLRRDAFRRTNREACLTLADSLAERSGASPSDGDVMVVHAMIEAAFELGQATDEDTAREIVEYMRYHGPLPENVKEAVEPPEGCIWVASDDRNSVIAVHKSGGPARNEFPVAVYRIASGGGIPPTDPLPEGDQPVGHQEKDAPR